MCYDTLEFLCFYQSCTKIHGSDLKLKDCQTKNKEARSNIAHCHIIEHLAGMQKAAGLLINKMEAQSESQSSPAAEVEWQAARTGSCRPPDRQPTGKPVKPAGKPVARELLNFKPVKPTGKPVKPAGKPVKPAGKPVGTGWTGKFEFI